MPNLALSFTECKRFRVFVSPSGSVGRLDTLSPLDLIGEEAWTKTSSRSAEPPKRQLRGCRFPFSCRIVTGTCTPVGWTTQPWPELGLQSSESCCVCRRILHPCLFLLTSSWKPWDVKPNLCVISLPGQGVLFLVGRLLLPTQAEIKILLVISSRNMSKYFCSYGGVEKALISYISPALELIISSVDVNW